MSNIDQEKIKARVKDYWNSQACGTQVTKKDKFSKEYFEDIERERYEKEPEIFSFAQFTRFHGQRLLEVGVGAGTDFLQWVRAGTKAHGIDITPEAIDHMQKRLKLYGLEAKELKVADSENLPFSDDQFEVVYSWGVIHHTPDTAKAFREIVRVSKPGGTCKIMVYHRHSLLAYFFWVKHALLKGRPWKSLSWVLYNHMESIGTKAYTKKEIIRILEGQPIENLSIRPILSFWDRLERFNPIFRAIAKLAATLLGRNKVGWFLTIEFRKKG